MLGFILQLHGDLRWLVALAALLTIVKYAAGWFRNMEYQRVDRILFAATTGLMDLNLLLGLILLVALGGGFPVHRIEHAVTMLIAVGVMHSSTRWRNSSSSMVKFRNGLLTVLVALVLVVVGVIRLRGGWTF